MVWPIGPGRAEANAQVGTADLMGLDEVGARTSTETTGPAAARERKSTLTRWEVGALSACQCCWVYPEVAPSARRPLTTRDVRMGG